MVAYWGAELTGKNPTVEVAVPNGYVLNAVMAALVAGGANATNKNAYFRVNVDAIGLEEGTKHSNVLCTLRPLAMEQVKLDLVFGENESETPVVFSLSAGEKNKFLADGSSVHLSGYFQPGPPMEEDMEDGEEPLDALSKESLRNMILNAAGNVNEDDDAEESEESEEEEQEAMQEDKPTKEEKPKVEKPKEKSTEEKQKPQKKRPNSTPTNNPAKKSKTQSTNWDQDVSDSSEEETPKEETPKKVEAVEETSSTPTSKKKRKKKNKNKNKGKPTN